VQNPGASAGFSVDKISICVAVKFIHRFPHLLKGSNPEGFDGNNPMFFKHLGLFSSDSAATSTTKLLIYSTSFKA